MAKTKPKGVTLDKLREAYNHEDGILKKILEDSAKAKHEACTYIDKNGKKRFDYLKMLEMYDNGEW